MDNKMLLEIFGGEIPASMQKNGTHKLCELIIGKLGSNKTQCKIAHTPRRICIYIEYQGPESIEHIIRGPKVDAPDDAISGFLRKYKLNTIAQLTEKDGAFFYIMKTATTVEDVARCAIEGAMKEMTWPKSMRWGASEISWVRPIENIMCILNDKPLMVKYGHIESTNFTFGHRFMAPDKITINSCDFDDYVALLKAHHVIVLPQERKNIITSGAASMLEPFDLRTLMDNALIDEIVGLVEYPVMVLGDIPEQFMSLPPELLQTTIRNNQRYIMSDDLNGNLAAKFVIVCNTKTVDDMQTVLAGNLKVLSARLNDAAFFWNLDRKKTLKEWGEGLANLTYHADFGSMADKVSLIANIATKIAKWSNTNIEEEIAFKAVNLAKNDLCTNLVKEFPELQGRIGYYYAKADGEDIEIAEAIQEHYKPVGPNDTVPNTILGAIISVADKLASLHILFNVGIKPSGSKDPYMLRRNAIGMIRCILDHKLNFSLNALELNGNILPFILERLRVMLHDASVDTRGLDTIVQSTSWNIYEAMLLIQNKQHLET